MPCQNCDKTAQPIPRGGMSLNPNLDAAELALIQAQVFEVKPEHKQFIPQIIEAIDKMKNIDQIPTFVRLASLHQVSNQVIQRIPCPYCQRHTWYRIIGSIHVAMLFEQGKIWAATRNEFIYWLKGTYWMLRAGYVKLIKPKFRRMRKW